MATQCGDILSKEVQWELSEANEEAREWTENGTSDRLWEEYQREMPAIREAIEHKVEKIAEARIDRHIERGAEREAKGELTPEKVASLFTKEYNEWPQAVREGVSRHLHLEEDLIEGGKKTLGALVPARELEKAFGIRLPHEEAPKDIIVTFKLRSLDEARGVLTHEFAEADYKIMSSEGQHQFAKMWLTTDRNRETEFFKGELYSGIAKVSNLHALKDSRENYCFWTTAFRRESHERLQELKEINPEKFNFCRGRNVAHERERLLAELK